MRGFLVGSVGLVGCSPVVVEVDGRGHRSLADAAEHAAPGATFTFPLDTVLEAGVDLPADVVIRGPVTLTASAGSVVTSAGALSLVDVVLRGQSPSHPVVASAGLVVEDGEIVLDVPHEVAALEVAGDVHLADTILTADGDVLDARRAIGRPESVRITDSTITGRLAVEADAIALEGLSGRIALDVDGPDVRITDSTLRTLEVRGRHADLIGLVLEGAARVGSSSAQLAAIDGGTWELASEVVVGSGLRVDAMGASDGDLDLAAVTTPLLQLTGVARAQVREVDGNQVYITGDAVFADGIRAHQATLAGPGDHRGITLTGPQPRLVATLCAITGVVVSSEVAPASLVLDNAHLENLVVVEPRDAEALHLIDTDTFATLRHVSWIGGSRSSTNRRFTQLHVTDSLFDVADFGAVDDWTQFQDTLVASEVPVAPVNGLALGDPGFLAPDDPRPAPDALYPTLGAFAGLHGDDALALWEALD
jgi:hypothetical protein